MAIASVGCGRYDLVQPSSRRDIIVFGLAVCCDTLLPLSGYLSPQIYGRHKPKTIDVYRFFPDLPIANDKHPVKTGRIDLNRFQIVFPRGIVFGLQAPNPQRHKRSRTSDRVALEIASKCRRAFANRQCFNLPFRSAAALLRLGVSSGCLARLR